MHQLAFIDYLVFTLYFCIVFMYGWWIYTRKKSAETSSTEYFLAEGSLTWWAIGASLIASNISAEQFIGMSGSGFKMGLAIAGYEWIAAATLIIVAVFFMPVYLENKIFTMPQFLAKRYNEKVALVMAVFWLLLYIVVNLTSILYLGALAINSLSGLNHFASMCALGLFAIIITLGGMKVIGFTDIIQVFFLVVGGLVTTWLAVTLVAEFSGSSGFLNGLKEITTKASSHFHMILPQGHSSYLDLPGLSVVLGGMWIANFNYWGCNQYITQRALGADIKTARNGLLFAAFLKLLMPLIVVLPGIAAYVLYQNGHFKNEMSIGGELTPDRAYPMLLNLLPAGLKGLSFAALTAAIVASLAGKANSIATIFSLDIYKKLINKNADETSLVRVGQWTIVLSVVGAILMVPNIGIDKKGGFQLIQEYTGFLSPGIFAMFIMGFFYRKTNSYAALFAIVGGFILSLLLKVLPELTDLSVLGSVGLSSPNDKGVFEIPFLDRMMIVFVFCVLMMIIISHFTKEENQESKSLKVNTSSFNTHNSFKIGSVIVIAILLFLYTYFY